MTSLGLSRGLCGIVGLLLAASVLAAPHDARKLAFSAADAKAAESWQQFSRELLFRLMKLDDLVRLDRGRDGRPGIALDQKVISAAVKDGYNSLEVEFNSTPTRRIKAIVTVPLKADRAPAVVCIHGHGGNRGVVYNPKNIYGGFALRLAEACYVTISVDVGRHAVYENGRTLMGERLWDVMRCVDHLVSRNDVDQSRIGCAGLSLGGEMAMWLGAMDTRIRATVSAGYLTTVANMRNGHCPCWEFPGLTESFDWADIYSLIAPRALMCQIGQQERAPGGFPVDIAKGAWAQVLPCYRVFDAEGKAELKIHPGGHIMEVASMVDMLDRELKSRAGRSP